MTGFGRFLMRKSLLWRRTFIPKSIHIDQRLGSLLRPFRVISSSAMRSHTPVHSLNPWRLAAFLPPGLSRNFAVQCRSMFIQIQSTPNPSSLMFYPGKAVMEVGSVDFPSARAAMSSPLTKSIFAIDGITRVFFVSDFVTVTKSDEASWDYLKPEVFAAIMDFYKTLFF